MDSLLITLITGTVLSLSILTARIIGALKITTLTSRLFTMIWAVSLGIFGQQPLPVETASTLYATFLQDSTHKASIIQVQPLHTHVYHPIYLNWFIWQNRNWLTKESSTHTILPIMHSVLSLPMLKLLLMTDLTHRLSLIVISNLMIIIESTLSAITSLIKYSGERSAKWSIKWVIT